MAPGTVPAAQLTQLLDWRKNPYGFFGVAEALDRNARFSVLRRQDQRFAFRVTKRIA
jgi:hypothetical protein